MNLDHCIELIRNSLMCTPDTSLTTFTWVPGTSQPTLDTKPFEKICVDWEAFMESVVPRVVTFEEIHGLANPLL